VYEQASDAQLAEATENLVRCVKAEDGSTDRANKRMAFGDVVVKLL
jgi:hypothetical protein